MSSKALIINAVQRIGPMMARWKNMKRRQAESSSYKAPGEELTDGEILVIRVFSILFVTALDTAICWYLVNRNLDSLRPDTLRPPVDKTPMTVKSHPTAKLVSNSSLTNSSTLTTTKTVKVERPLAAKQHLLSTPGDKASFKDSTKIYTLDKMENLPINNYKIY